MKFAVMVGAVAMAGAALAKPVAWYHFDDEAPGTQAAASGTIVNAANPGTLDGTVRGLKWNSTEMNNGRYLYYTNFTGSATTWYDPVSGEQGDKTAMFVKISGPSTGTGASGLMTVPDNEALHLGRFTVEFFFRKEPDSVFKSQVLPIQLYNSPTNTFAWQLRFAQNGSSLTLTTSKADGTTAISKAFSVSPALADCLWHHAALTYDGSTFEVFYDYKSVGSVSGSIAYASDVSTSILAVGNSPRETWGRYHGWIDELRISDEVLTKEQFLRTSIPGCDGDTLVYIPCDTDAEMNTGVNAIMGPGANLKTAVLLPIEDTGRAPVPDAGNGVADTLRSGLFAEETVANTACYHFTTNQTDKVTGFIQIGDLADSQHTLLTNDELTIEFFVKMDPSAKENNHYLWSTHLKGATHSIVARAPHTNGNLNNRFEFNFANVADGGKDVAYRYTGCSAYDGNWHHLAAVYDGKASNLWIYVDYKLSHTATNFVMNASQYAGSYEKGVQFGMAYNNQSGNASGHNGWMDDIRITKRALLPREFLTTRTEVPAVDKVAGHQVLFYAPLDGDVQPYPFPNDSKAATVSGFSYDTENLPLEEIAAREAMGLGVTNAAAVGATEGKMTFADATALAGSQSMTVEFYAKAPQASKWTPFVRHEGSQVQFQICKGEGSNLAVMLGNNLTYGGYAQFSGARLNGDNWHHYAVTIEKKDTEDGVKTQIRAYRDHVELPWVPTSVDALASGALETRFSDAHSAALYLGGAKTWGTLNGMLDEVRIVDGVLDVEDFMDECPRRGFSFLLR